MMPAQSRVDAGIWSVPGLDPVIEYSRAVLNEILIQVLDAYGSYLAGGYEVGGVLFGQREGDTIRILAHRPIDIDPPRPSFVLSKGDEQRLEQLLKNASADLELVGMQVVGWYHSHTRSEVFLSEADVEIYDRYFPEPWQIAMVLRPSDVEPVRIGFFLRESDGFIRTDQSYQEFAVDAPVHPGGAKRKPPWEIDRHGRVKEELLPEIEPETYALPPEPERQSLLRRSGKYLLLLGVLLAIGAGVWSVLILREPEPSMGLKITPVDGELLIQWNVKNPAFENGEAVLFIVDGANRVDLPIDRRKMKFPQHTYKPLTGRVDVRLRTKLSWGRSWQEVATYLAHPDLGKPSVELLEAQRQEAKAKSMVEAAKAALREEARRAGELGAKLEELNQRRQQLAEAKKRPEVKRLALTPRQAPKPATPKELPAAPEIAGKVVAGAAPPVQMPVMDPRARPPVEPPKPSPIVPNPVARPALPSVTPAAVPAASVPKVASITATSGRIIWTGDLPKGAVLTIEGRKPSRGAVNAELPGVPVRIGAYPAELTNEGLRVLTANPKYGTSKAEEASAANGYTKTQYVYDPKSVRDLIVEQMPMSQDLRRIVVRAGGRKLSAIVIEWQVVTQ